VHDKFWPPGGAGGKQQPFRFDVAARRGDDGADLVCAHDDACRMGGGGAGAVGDDDVGLCFFEDGGDVRGVKVGWAEQDAGRDAIELRECERGGELPRGGDEDRSATQGVGVRLQRAAGLQVVQRHVAAGVADEAVCRQASGGDQVPKGLSARSGHSRTDR
jgi:hypothetical protein